MRQDKDLGKKSTKIFPENFFKTGVFLAAVFSSIVVSSFIRSPAFASERKIPFSWQSENPNDESFRIPDDQLPEPNETVILVDPRGKFGVRAIYSGKTDTKNQPLFQAVEIVQLDGQGNEVAVGPGNQPKGDVNSNSSGTGSSNDSARSKTSGTNSPPAKSAAGSSRSATGANGEGTSESGEDHPSGRGSAATGSSFGDNGFSQHLQNAHDQALESAIMSGVATAIYRGLIYTASDEAQFNELRTQIDQQSAKLKEMRMGSLHLQLQAAKDVSRALSDLRDKFVIPNLSVEQLGIKQITCPDPRMRALLIENRALLNSIYTYSPVQKKAQNLGLLFNWLANREATGLDSESAEAYLKFAQAMADLAIGWSPILNVSRSIYEASTGVSLTSGLPLSLEEKTLAAIDVLTFGFGSHAKDLKEKAASVLENFAGLTATARKNAIEVVVSSKELWINSSLKKWVDKSTLLSGLLTKSPQELQHYKTLVEKTENIRVTTPHGQVSQEFTREALDLYEKAKSGKLEFGRQGIFGKSRINIKGHNPNYWGIDLHDIGEASYSARYGGYSDGIEFIEYAKLKPDATFIVRKAPSGVVSSTGSTFMSKGGALELVVEDGGMETTRFLDLRKK